MTFVVADRVRETNAVTGTGNVTLGGSVAGWRTIASQMSNGQTTWYEIVDNVANAWEIGVGTWNTGNTLSRTTVLSSSNAGALVNFAGNACDCFMGLPAAAITPPNVSIYTSSGAIALMDTLSIVNSGSSLAMTLANDTVNNRARNIKRFGAGTVSITATIDGVSQAVLLNGGGTIKENLTLQWIASLSSYVAL